MGYNTNKIKERAEELAEGYQDARAEEFTDQFMDMLMTLHKENVAFKAVLTEDDVQGFLDSFTFDSEEEWAFDAVQSELDAIADAKYEQMRDEEMGL